MLLRMMRKGSLFAFAALLDRAKMSPRRPGMISHSYERQQERIWQPREVGIMILRPSDAPLRPATSIKSGHPMKSTPTKCYGMLSGTHRLAGVGDGPEASTPWPAEM